MKRILIIGGNGAGKSTLARQLAPILDLPLVHLDQLYWKDDWQAVSRDEFDKLLQTELEKDRWILDGCMQRTLRHRLEYADTVIYLDFPAWLCVWGAVKRLFQNHGKSRPDMGGNCVERFDQRSLSFIWSIFGFNRRNRGNFYSWINQAEHVNTIILKSRRQVRKFLKEVKQCPS